MSTIEQLIDAYADACFDQGLNRRTEDDEPENRREKVMVELRRLAALEKAIMDAEPVAWIDIEGTSDIVSAPRLYSDGSNSEVPLYTLNGIKP